MVWHSIGMINRTLYGRLEIRNISSRGENISLVSFPTLEEKFRISARPYNILYILAEVNY